MVVVTPGGPDYNDGRGRDYSSILKTGPRHEISGPPYQDRTQSTPIGEIHAQAHHAADFNRTVNQQREIRGDYMQNQWRRPHEQPTTTGLAPPAGTSEASSITASRTAPASHSASAGLQPPSMVPAQSPQMMMTAAPYSQPIAAQNTLQSMRGMVPPYAQKRSTPTDAPAGSQSAMPQAQGYNYPQTGAMWQTQQPQYSYSHPTQAQASPHAGQQSPAAPLRHSGIGGQVQPGGMPYSPMPGYPAQNQGISYDQTPRQYLPQTGPPAPAVTQGWSGQPAQSTQWWTSQQQ